MVERFDDGMSRDLESVAQIIPDRDAELAACLCQTEESIPAIAAIVASRPAESVKKVVARNL